MRSISILTPIYNSEKTLEIFFSSLEKQDVNLNIEYVEFLICNDGSNDSSTHIINKHLNILREKFIVKIILNKKNMGWRYSLSKLYENSHGDIIVFIDSDSIPTNNDWLKNLTDKILSKSALIVQGDFWSQLEKNTFWSREHEKWRKSICFSKLKNKKETLNTINTRNLAIDRSVIETVKNNLGYFLDPVAKLAGADTKLGFEIIKLGHLIHLEKLAKTAHVDPTSLLKIIKQKIRHGYEDGKIGIRYKKNFFNSVYTPFIKNNVSFVFSVPITICFYFANFFGYLKYRK